MFKYVSYTPFTDEYTTHEFNELNDKCTVHRFDVPYVSVECENEEDFAELMAYQREEIYATEISAEVFNENIIHTDQMQRIHNRANAYYAELMNPVNARYFASERESWPEQVEDAKIYLNTGEASEMLEALAAAENVSVDVYALGVLDNKTAYDQFRTDAMVDKKVFLDALRAEVGLFSDGNSIASWVIPQKQ